MMRPEIARLLLDEAFKSVKEDMRCIAKGTYAAGQCDGWSDITKNKVQAIMFSADGQVSNKTSFARTKTDPSTD